MEHYTIFLNVNMFHIVLCNWYIKQQDWWHNQRQLFVYYSPSKLYSRGYFSLSLGKTGSRLHLSVCPPVKDSQGQYNGTHSRVEPFEKKALINLFTLFFLYPLILVCKWQYEELWNTFSFVEQAPSVQGSLCHVGTSNDIKSIRNSLWQSVAFKKCWGLFQIFILFKPESLLHMPILGAA